MAGSEPKDVATAGGEFSFDGTDLGTRSQWSAFARLIRAFVLVHWGVLAIGIAAMTLTAATAGVLPFLLQKVGDEVFVQKDSTLLFFLPALVVLVMFVRAAADWVSTVAEGSLGTKIMADLRVRMFDTIAGADLA